MRGWLFALLGVFAGGLQASVLDDFFTGLKTLHGNFEQTVKDSNGEQLQQAEGEVWISRPGKFRWEYRKPYEQSIISDAQRIWVFEPDLDQATVRPVDDSLGETPALLLSGERPLAQDFDITALGKRSDGEYFQLVPHNSEGGYVSLLLVIRGGLLRRMELRDGFNQTTFLDFSRLSRNPVISDTVFDFVPPPGVDVIGHVQEHLRDNE